MKLLAPEAFAERSAVAAAQSGAASAADRTPAAGAGADSFWLERLFWLAEHAPGVLRTFRGPLAEVALRCSHSIRAGTLANARRILGSDSTDARQRAFARRVVEHFILFCHDVGSGMRMSADELLGEIEQIDGHEHYAAARSLRRGAIVVTAHMGSFEVGMAALRKQDAGRPIHVVFRRDLVGRFERMRSALRAKLGVVEAPVDDGWTIWMRLRDALLRDEVVVMQADRVMPGQKGSAVIVLGGEMLLPSGPVKLAMATGAPIVPVITVRMPSGKIRLCVEPAIEVGTAARESIDAAMRRIASVVEKYVSRFGDQWLMLQPAWVGSEAVSR
jgi:KDO2-lipid IV(A) lauroyltransferase